MRLVLQLQRLVPSLDWVILVCILNRTDVTSALGSLQRVNSLFLTFMLPCTVIDFFLNNQIDALIIQMYSVIKLYMFRATSLPIFRSYLLYIQHW
jgi:hypothetical protein